MKLLNSIRRLFGVYREELLVETETKEPKSTYSSKLLEFTPSSSTELHCPITGDLLEVNNIYTCVCGTSYGLDTVESKYIVECIDCKESFIKLEEEVQFINYSGIKRKVNYIHNLYVCPYE